MQIPINKEIRHYEEDVFMGLSLRQVLWSCAALAAAVAVYFLARNTLDKDTVSWLCMAAAVPFAAMGFFRYDGMGAWKFFRAVVRCQLLGAGVRVWKSENRLMQARKKTKRRNATHEAQ